MVLNKPHNYSILLCPFSFATHNRPICSNNNQISRIDISGIIWVNGIVSIDFSRRRIRTMLKVCHPWCWKCTIHLEDVDTISVLSQTKQHPVCHPECWDIRETSRGKEEARAIIKSMGLLSLSYLLLVDKRAVLQK